MDRLQDPSTRRDFVDRALADARSDVFLNTAVGKDMARGDSAGARSAVSADHAVPEAPFLGTRILRDIPLGEVFDLLDLDELYRLQWGARGSGDAYRETVRSEFEPALARSGWSSRRACSTAPPRATSRWPRPTSPT